MTVGDDGFATARFPLPETILAGEGTLSFAIEDGGVVETASKTIPILVATVDLRAYPEGGELIAGIENRVYIEAIAPNGRPADIVAELVDPSGAVIATAKTEHEGRGVFTVTPELNTTYTLQVVERVAGRRIVRRSVECSFVPLIGAEGYAEPAPPEDPWLR